ncbi:MAG TPA: ABC transporter permease, partial [Ktedonobacterales bacterium]|nr:ABC transporter permease [Ktedonobacterales bacterium]
MPPRREPFQRKGEQLLVGGIVEPATDAGGVWQWHEQRAIPLERLADDILQPLFYRDVRYAVPFLIQFWLFASPVAYPASLVPAKWRWLYGLNPMAGVIEGFRWSLSGRGGVPPERMIL